MRARTLFVAGICCLLLLALLPARGATPRTRRVSVSSSGDQADDSSFYPDISDNGQFVAYESTAEDLVPNDGNGFSDIFVYNRETKKTRRVSITSQGEEATGDSYNASISASGRYVAFESFAEDMIGSDDNGRGDVFVHDRRTERTRRVSVTSNGTQAETGSSTHPAISASGRFVAFQSFAEDLVNSDTNLVTDVFVHDRETDKTRRVSVTSQGNEAEGESSDPAISGNGRFVAFSSYAEDLVGNDSNGNPDIFVRDRETGRTKRVSIRTDGGQAQGRSFESSMSDGRFVAFYSEAENLVGFDDNEVADVFVYDRKLKRTRLVSLRSNGNQAEDGGSTQPSITRDGRFVAFESDAVNLVGNDTNGVTDVFVRDRKTGRTRRVSVANNGDQAELGNSQEPEISNGGRFVTFMSEAENLVGNDDNERYDIFVRGPLR